MKQIQLKNNETQWKKIKKKIKIKKKTFQTNSTLIILHHYFDLYSQIV